MISTPLRPIGHLPQIRRREDSKIKKYCGFGGGREGVGDNEDRERDACMIDPKGFFAQHAPCLAGRFDLLERKSAGKTFRVSMPRVIELLGRVCAVSVGTMKSIRECLKSRNHVILRGRATKNPCRPKKVSKERRDASLRSA